MIKKSLSWIWFDQVGKLVVQKGMSLSLWRNKPSLSLPARYVVQLSLVHCDGKD